MHPLDFAEQVLGIDLPAFYRNLMDQWSRPIAHLPGEFLSLEHVRIALAPGRGNVLRVSAGEWERARHLAGMDNLNPTISEHAALTFQRAEDASQVAKDFPNARPSRGKEERDRDVYFIDNLPHERVTRLLADTYGLTAIADVGNRACVQVVRAVDLAEALESLRDRFPQSYKNLAQVVTDLRAGHAANEAQARASAEKR